MAENHKTHILPRTPITGSKLSGSITAGEMEVLKWISEGDTNKEIANKLFISVRTVEVRRKKLLQKTNTRNAAALVKYAMQKGLIE